MTPIFRFLVLAFVAVLPVLPARARGAAERSEPRAAGAGTFSLTSGRDPIATLDGMVRFHPGDDAGWANPNFDDSVWPLIRSNASWSGQGYKGMSGFAWYRFRVEVPPGMPQLGLELPEIYTDYEVFANGQRIGGYGGMPPHAVEQHTLPQMLMLPPTIATQHVIVIAIRVYHWPVWAMYHGGGLTGAPAIGSAHLLQERVRDEALGRYWGQVSSILVITLDGIGVVIALVFFLSHPAEREYLWFGLMLLFDAALQAQYTWYLNHPSSILVRDWIDSLGIAAELVFSLLFYRVLLSARRSWFFNLALIAICCRLLTNLSGNVALENLIGSLLLVPYRLWLAVTLIVAAFRGQRQARLLLVPVLLQSGLSFAGDLQSVLFNLGKGPLPFDDKLLGSWPFQFYPSDLIQVLFLLAMTAILSHRFVWERREQDRVHTELAAARSVQQVLVPAVLPPTPGLAIETAYEPAQEVGGDFFEVLALRSGATLVAIGDVSGKGLPAALTVSLAVGTLRTTVEYTESPAEILAGLNRRLCGAGFGFTTCLVLKIAPDRRSATMANAGHLSPYLNGCEVAGEADLPLGLERDTRFAESRIELRAGDHLTVLTDGVPEATHNRKLLGFERTAGLSLKTAGAVAEAARAFGQSDDITVLTVDVLGGEQAHDGSFAGAVSA